MRTDSAPLEPQFSRLRKGGDVAGKKSKKKSKKNKKNKK